MEILEDLPLLIIKKFTYKIEKGLYILSLGIQYWLGLAIFRITASSILRD